jgi:hypothetical protein
VDPCSDGQTTTAAAHSEAKLLRRPRQLPRPAKFDCRVGNHLDIDMDRIAAALNGGASRAAELECIPTRLDHQPATAAPRPYQQAERPSHTGWPGSTISNSPRWLSWGVEVGTMFTAGPSPFRHRPAHPCAVCGLPRRVSRACRRRDCRARATRRSPSRNHCREAKIRAFVPHVSVLRQSGSAAGSAALWRSSAQ